ncbi:MAG: M23 family metallopeptidase, partial [Flavobacteriales bacterium]
MRILHLLAFAAAALCSTAARAQGQDTSGYGGADGLDIFDELVPAEEAEDPVLVIGMAARALGILCDVNDSIAMIPGYDMYCHWNTEVLFGPERQGLSAHDTLCLSLAERDDDFNMPCAGHLTSPFGWRKGRMHYGIDLKLNTGDPVVCAFPGMV